MNPMKAAALSLALVAGAAGDSTHRLGDAVSLETKSSQSSLQALNSEHSLLSLLRMCEILHT